MGQGSGGKSSKIGRNKKKCDRYQAQGRREKNKARKAATRQRRLENAAIARELRELKVIARALAEGS